MQFVAPTQQQAYMAGAPAYSAAWLEQMWHNTPEGMQHFPGVMPANGNELQKTSPPMHQAQQMAHPQQVASPHYTASPGPGVELSAQQQAQQQSMADQQQSAYPMTYGGHRGNNQQQQFYASNRAH